MSTILIAGILIGSIVLVIIILARIDRKDKQKQLSKVMHYFSELGSRHKLTFSSQEILRNRVIGLDGIQRKLLILKSPHKEQDNGTLIDLDKLKKCSVIREYGTVPNDGGKRSDSYLERIVLQFEFRNSQPGIDLPFYGHIENHLAEAPELEAKAKDWEAVLSKMIKGPLNNMHLDKQPGN